MAFLLVSCDQAPGPDEQLQNKLVLLDLPANEWVRYHESDWWRKGHSGMAYDSKRGHLLVFGSDTHGEDWDNAVHEFIPVERRWVHHGSDAPKDTYRIDADGIPVSGEGKIQPWSMHTYDGVAYDPVTDSVLVVGAPDHNPIGKAISGGRAKPVWRYPLVYCDTLSGTLEQQQWEAIKPGSGKETGFFGAATAFDISRKRLMICGGGLWEWPAGEEKIDKVGPGIGCLHRTMVFDSRRQDLYLFGAYKPSTQVWRLQRDLATDEPKSWLKLEPGGDAVPPYSTSPVAFDQENGVFLLVADNPGTDSDSSSTFVYDPVRNAYQKVPNAVLPRVGMNFMMAWDAIHQVFFLVTGTWNTPTTVWAMRLDMSQLP